MLNFTAWTPGLLWMFTVYIDCIIMLIICLLTNSVPAPSQAWMNDWSERTLWTNNMLIPNIKRNISKLLNTWKDRIKRDWITSLVLAPYHSGTQDKDIPCSVSAESSRKSEGSLWSYSTWEEVCWISRELPDRTVVFWKHEIAGSS